MARKIKINEKERQAFVSAAAKAAFEPRIDKLIEKATKVMNDRIAKAHPEFVRLLSDKNARPYLDVGQGLSPSQGSGSRSMRYPYWGGIASFNRWDRLVSGSWIDGVSSILCAVTFPPKQHDASVTLMPQSIVDEYVAIIEDMQKAVEALKSVAYGAIYREDIEAVAPELMKYLPVREERKTALAVIPKDAAAKLAALGIPPTGKK